MRSGAAVAQMVRATGAPTETIREAGEFSRNYTQMNTADIEEKVLTPEEVEELKRRG